jgi:hypothetical protein
LGRALRTETTINDPGDFNLRKGLTNLTALREVGFTANRRLLHVEHISHDPATWSAGRATYDLRRLRLHGLIERIPGTHRYQVTDTGLHHAMFLTRVHDRLIRTGTAHHADPHPPAPAPLRAATRAYDTALNQLTQHAGWQPETPPHHRIPPPTTQT